MGFKNFFDAEKKNQETFDKVFEKYYNRGYFGKIDEGEIKSQQKIWFNKFSRFVEENNGYELIESLSNKENIVSREFFTEMTGIDVKYKTKENVISIIKDYVSDAKQELRNGSK